MQGYNLIAVFTPDAQQWLFLKRLKEPYLGLYNLPGGKIEPGEDGLAAAYRELEEETGILPQRISLTHLMDFHYPLDPCYVEVYVGKLDQMVPLVQEIHPLEWLPLSHDFFSMEHFAGEGNIGHILEHIKQYHEELFR